MTTISSRATQTPPSPIRKLAPLAADAVSQGVKVLHLNIGQPDIQTPVQFYQKLHTESPTVLAYEQSQGHEALRGAWVEYLNRELGVSLERNQMLITSGASEALIFAFMILCDPGDEVLIFDPSYANYISFAAIAGVALKPIATQLSDNFGLPSIEEIKRHIGPKTHAILICNPNNPTGTVYPEARLKELLSLCDQQGLFLVADETYREFAYDGNRCRSLLELAPQHPQVVVVDSLSKRFSLCGARIGCLLSSHPGIQQAALNLAQARLAVATLEQMAAAHLLRSITPDFLDSVRREYENRRNVLISGLRSIPGVSVQTPQGAFYTLVDLPVSDAEHFASYLLKEFRDNGETVFVAPAQGFYLDPARGKRQARLAYVLNAQSLKRATDLLKLGLEAYSAQYGSQGKSAS